ncbi:MAG: hypothetical protein JNG84_13965 [Archangium sp.]|nr:hypothetical protein [Archangium sp.]
MAPKTADVSGGETNTLSADQLPTIEFMDFDHFAKARDLTKSMPEALKAKYVLPPLGYAGLFDVPLHHTDTVFHSLVRHLQTIKTYLNTALAKKDAKLRVTDPQLLTNILAEGTILYLRGLMCDKDMVHFFTASGVSAYVLKKGDDNKVSELLPTWYKYSPGMGEFQSALMANAAYFTSMLTSVRNTVTPGKWAALPPEGQFFWWTVEYNSKPAVVANRIRRHGLDAYTRGWAAEYTNEELVQTDQKPDPAKFKKHVFYNASWRTATFELLNAVAQLDPNPDHAKPEDKHVLAMKKLPITEALELESKLYSEMKQKDEQTARAVMYMFRRLSNAWAAFTKKREGNQNYANSTKAAFDKAKPLADKLSSHNMEARAHLAKLAGPRGAKLAPQAQKIQAAYALLNAQEGVSPTHGRSPAPVEIMTEVEFEREWKTLNAIGAPRMQAVANTDGYRALKEPFGKAIDDKVKAAALAAAAAAAEADDEDAMLAKDSTVDRDKNN